MYIYIISGFISNSNTKSSVNEVLREQQRAGLAHSPGAVPRQDFYVTSVSTVMSPASAFASCATGYPLSYVATKLSLGYALTDLQNPMTSATTAYHEPCLDYCAIRFASVSLCISSWKGFCGLFRSSIRWPCIALTHSELWWPAILILRVYTSMHCNACSCFPQ